MAGFLEALARLFSPPPAPSERGLTYSQVWGSGGDWEPHNSTAGVSVTAVSAMRSIAVQAAVRLLVNDIGSLPVDAFRAGDQGKKELRRPDWVVEPNPGNPNETWEDHVKQVVYAILTDGNAFTYVFPSVFEPRGLTVLDPGDVDVVRTGPLAEVAYRVKGIGDLDATRVLHVPWLTPPGAKRGLNPIEAAKQGLGIALAADEFVGSYFGNGAVLSGVLEFPAGVDLTPEQIAALKADFARKHVGARKSHAVGALTGGGTFKPFDYKNRDAQLIELRDQIVEDVARLFGIPPHMLGSQKPGAVGYASVEQRSIDYVTHAVLPIVRRIEVAYSRLLRGQKTYLRFNLEGLKRGDQTARATFYGTMLQNKVIRREEVRALEDLPFDPEGTGYLETPNNNPPDAPAEEPQRSEPVSITVTQAPSGPAEALAAFREEVASAAAEEREAALRAQGWLDNAEAAALGGQFVGQAEWQPLVELVRDLHARATAEPEPEPEPEPVNRTVRRDGSGRIVEVIDEQGGRVSRRVVDRDEAGRILAVRAAS